MIDHKHSFIYKKDGETVDAFPASLSKDTHFTIKYICLQGFSASTITTLKCIISPLKMYMHDSQVTDMHVYYSNLSPAW
jgi:adenylosuccinate synthase